MERFSFEKLPPDILKKVRNLNSSGTKPDHPFYKIEERKGLSDDEYVAGRRPSCRGCGEVVKEGEPTILFHYAPDDDRMWMRNKFTIHRDECGKEQEWTRCPKCKTEVPSETWSQHWQSHKKESTTKESASNARQIRMRDQIISDLGASNVPSIYSPSSIALQLPDKWKIVRIKTLGDAMYEGTLLSHCLANREMIQMFRDRYGDEPSAEFKFPEAPEVYPADISDEFKKHFEGRASSRIMSLRDPSGIPKATWWEPKERPEGVELREVAGFNNQRIKDKHVHRILQYMRHGLTQSNQNEGRFEHSGILPEGQGPGAFVFAPVNTFKISQLPKLDEPFMEQHYPIRTASLKDYWMGKLGVDQKFLICEDCQRTGLKHNKICSNCQGAGLFTSPASDHSGRDYQRCTKCCGNGIMDRLGALVNNNICDKCEGTGLLLRGSK